MTDPTPIRQGAVSVTAGTILPKLAPVSTASALQAQARYLAGLEVDDMLKAADALQDAMNTVRNTGLAPVGVLELVERMARDLPQFSNTVVALMMREAK